MQPNEEDNLLDSMQGKFFVPGNRRRINIQAICVNIFVPWATFTALLALLSFTYHYEHPVMTWVIFGGVCCMVAYFVYATFKARKAHRGTWYPFAAVSLCFGVILATVLGSLNYYYHTELYYDIENLNTYPEVDPATDNGQQFMDAGRAYFTDGTGLDLQKTMGFKNLDTYCVAPIVSGDEQLTTYDFWAVGVNCCDGDSSVFRCGEFNNPHARAGLRVMRSDFRYFYRLAVVQAEAAYNIKAMHPVFFHWVQDPLAEVNKLWNTAREYFWLETFSHLVFTVFTVICATIVFSRHVS